MGRPAHVDRFIERSAFIGQQGPDGRSALQQGRACIDGPAKDRVESRRGRIPSGGRSIGIPLLGRRRRGGVAGEDRIDLDPPRAVVLDLEVDPFALITGKVEGLDAPGRVARIFAGLVALGTPEAPPEPLEEQARVLVEPVVVDHGPEGRIAASDPKVEIAIPDGEIGGTGTPGQRQGQARAVEGPGLGDPKIPGGIQRKQRSRGVEGPPGPRPTRTALRHGVEDLDPGGCRGTGRAGDPGDP